MDWPWTTAQRRRDAASAGVSAAVVAGEPAQAEAIVRRAMRRIKSRELQSDLLNAYAWDMLEAGHVPALLEEAVAGRLSVADGLLRAGKTAEAAHEFGKAVELACDPVLHLQSVDSPLAAQPERFFSSFRHSETAKAIRASRGRSAASVETAGEGPTNVLVVTRQNTNFLGELLEHLEASPRYRHRLLDIAETELLHGLRTPGRMSAEILTGRKGAAARVRALIGADLDWADVVFIEWCSAHSVLLNLIDPGKARVIVRLHSYEAFTPWPHLLDFSRVDDMVFVSAHVRDLVETAVPGLAEGPASKLHVLPLGLRLGRYVKPKSENARFTLGLVGWRQVAKDPLWALQVVRRLRETDERFRLVLVGDPFEAEVSAATRAYGSRLDAELAELVAAGAVQQWGRTNDIPGALTEIGVILSSSVRESFHAGLVEGAASGAVPVVRHWPFFAGRRNGARTLFPAEWVVDTPEQAAARILETTHDTDVWRRTGQAASEHALATWEWDVVKEGYDRLLSC